MSTRVFLPTTEERMSSLQEVGVWEAIRLRNQSYLAEKHPVELPGAIITGEDGKHQSETETQKIIVQ